MKTSLHFLRTQMGLHFKLEAISPISFMVMIINPVGFSAIGLILGKAYSQDAMQVIVTVIGGGLLGLWGNVMYQSAFDITRDRWDGVLEQIIGCPVDFNKILYIRVMTDVLIGTVSLIGSFVVASIFLGLRLSWYQALWLVISVGVTLIGLWCMGVVMANLNALSRGSKLIITFIDMPIIVLCGFLFPIELLPRWVQWIASIFPVRWSGSVLKASVSLQTIDVSQMLIWIMLALLVSLVYFILTRWLSVLVQTKIRVNGDTRHI